MKKSHIFFGIATLFVAIYAIDKYGTNTDCYEIIPSQRIFDPILLDKCKGRSFFLAKVQLDTNEDGKIDGYAYRWTRIRDAYDGELVWENQK